MEKPVKTSPALFVQFTILFICNCVAMFFIYSISYYFYQGLELTQAHTGEHVGYSKYPYSIQKAVLASMLYTTALSPAIGTYFYATKSMLRNIQLKYRHHALLCLGAHLFMIFVILFPLQFTASTESLSDSMWIIGLSSISIFLGTSLYYFGMIYKPRLR